MKKTGSDPDVDVDCGCVGGSLVGGCGLMVSICRMKIRRFDSKNWKLPTTIPKSALYHEKSANRSVAVLGCGVASVSNLLFCKNHFWFGHFFDGAAACVSVQWNMKHMWKNRPKVETRWVGFIFHCTLIYFWFIIKYYVSWRLCIHF